MHCERFTAVLVEKMRLSGVEWFEQEVGEKGGEEGCGEQALRYLRSIGGGGHLVISSGEFGRGIRSSNE